MISEMRDRHTEKKLSYSRTIIAVIIVLTFTAIVIARLSWLQISSHAHYSTLSTDNRVRLEALPPSRGLIRDRQGRLLAQNLASYRLELVPEQVDDLEATLQQLAQLLELTPNDIKRFRRLKKRKRRFESIPLKFQLTPEEMARFSARRVHFPGVDITVHLSRHYPYGPLSAHVVGYVGRIDADNLKVVNAVNYAGTTHYGKTGIERHYEQSLHGQVGNQQVETNAAGRQIRVLNLTPPTPGNDLTLTLDIELQRVLLDALGDNNGSIVAIEPATGEILAMVSKPTYDANLFVNGIDHKNYNRLNTDYARPLFNRALRGQYPPGSTIKPIMALAGLHYGSVRSQSSIFCPGFYQLPDQDHKYRDWKRSGHGHADMDYAISQSCDVYFYDLAKNLGIDRMHEFFSAFGVGQKTGIDLTGERSGLMPSQAWKKRRRSQVWFPGETLITGIGQGFMLTTPLQLAHVTATLATQGKRMRPHLLKSSTQNTIESQSLPLAPVSLPAQHWAEVLTSMRNVVHGPHGTAKKIKDTNGYEIAGKTGTAQVFALSQDDEKKLKPEDIAKHLRDHALFVGFAPVREPKIAVAVIVEHGGSGGAIAAPIAGKVITYYMENFVQPETAQP